LDENVRNKREKALFKKFKKSFLQANFYDIQRIKSLWILIVSLNDFLVRASRRLLEIQYYKGKAKKYMKIFGVYGIIIGKCIHKLHKNRVRRYTRVLSMLVNKYIRPWLERRRKLMKQRISEFLMMYSEKNPISYLMPLVLRKIRKLQHFFKTIQFQRYTALNIGNYFWGYIERIIAKPVLDIPLNAVSLYDKLKACIKEKEQPMDLVSNSDRKKAMNYYFKVRFIKT